MEQGRALCHFLKRMAASNPLSASPLTVGQLLAGMGLFGSSTPLAKVIGEHYSIFTASCMRMVIASIALAPFVAFMTPRFARMSSRDFLVVSAISLLGMVGFSASLVAGMKLTSGVVGSTIMSATPAATALGAVIFYKSAMNGRKAGALGLAVLGVLVVNVFRHEANASDVTIIGSALIVLAVCFEVAFTLLSRQLSDGTTSLEATLAASLLAIPAFVTLAFAFDPRPLDLTQGDTGAIAALLFWGAAAGGLAPVLWYQGVRKAPGALTAGAMAVMPLTALLLSYALLGEAFRWVHLAGFGLVFAGVLLMIREHASSDGPAKAKVAKAKAAD